MRPYPLAAAISFVLTLAVHSFAAGTSFAPGAWKPLFNGKDLRGWEINSFGGAGEVTVQDGKIMIGAGTALTGVHWTNEVLKSNYEVEVQAMKIDGNDFFAALTLPARESHFTFVDGGWGGTLVGISSINGADASENETTQYIKFEKGKWYDLRVRVTDSKIQAYIDGDKVIDVITAGHKISMRAGEIEEAVPFGISSYQTQSAVREVKVRSIPANPPKIVLIAGRKSHGPGEHEYEKCLKGLKTELEKMTNIVLDAQVETSGWPANEETLDDADTIVFFTDGSDHKIEDHPLLRGSHLQTLDHQMKRGAGLVVIHYSVFVPHEKAGPKFQDWVGGYFDYETGDAPNHWWSKIETRDYQVFPAVDDSPILKGVPPFKVKEEFYFNMRFPDNKNGLVPIITFDPEKKDWSKVVAWSLQRPDGGRGFAYTGGHFASNWEEPAQKQLFLNAILWTAHALP